jgi:hypothetical protein
VAVSAAESQLVVLVARLAVAVSMEVFLLHLLEMVLVA